MYLYVKCPALLSSIHQVAIETIENMRTVATLTKEELFFQEYARLTAEPFK